MTPLVAAMLLHHRRNYAALGVLTLVGSALLVSTLSVTLFAFRTDAGEFERLSALQISDAMAQVEGARVFNVMMLVLVAISIASLVASSSSFALQARRRELAALRLLGAPRHQIVSTAVGEIFAVALVTSLVGSVVGLMLAPSHLSLEASVGLFPRDLPLPPSWQAALVGATGAVIFAVIGGVMPAITVSRTRPVDALGYSEPQAILSPFRLLSSAALAGAALWVHLFGSSPDAEPSGPSLAISVLWLSSLLLSSPALLQAATRKMADLAHRRGSPIVMIAASMVSASPRRSSTVSAPVVVVIGLMLPLGMIMAAGRAASEAEQREPLRAETVISGSDMPLDRSAFASVQAIRDVTCVLRYETVSGYVYRDDPNSIDPPQVRAFTPECVLVGLETSVVDGDLTSVGGTLVAVAGDGAVGDELIVSDPTGGETTFVVAAVLEPTAFLEGDILVDVGTVAPGVAITDSLWFVVGADPEIVADVLLPLDEDVEARSVEAWVASTMADAGRSQRTGLAMIFIVPLILALAATATSSWGLVSDCRRSYERLTTVGLLPSQIRKVGSLQLLVIFTVATSQVCVVTFAVRSWLAATTPLMRFHLTPEIPVALAAACAIAIFATQQFTAFRAVRAIQRRKN